MALNNVNYNTQIRIKLFTELQILKWGCIECGGGGALCSQTYREGLAQMSEPKTPKYLSKIIKCQNHTP